VVLYNFDTAHRGTEYTDKIKFLITDPLSLGDLMRGWGKGSHIQRQQKSLVLASIADLELFVPDPTSTKFCI
jgi:hypothetical protein